MASDVRALPGGLHLPAVLAVAVASLVACGGGEPDAPAQPRPSAAEAPIVGDDASSAVSPVDASDLEPWPAPARDHDPLVMIRPAPGGRRILHAGRETAMLYVNSIGRPTIVDFTTGDQSEVDVADTRNTDRILVERGGVVATRESNSSLPVATERATAFTIVRGLPAPGDDSRTPVLCLSVVCASASGTGGRFVDEYTEVRSIGEVGDVEQGIAALLGSAAVEQDGRFSVFELENGRYRLPSPAQHGVLWVMAEAS